MARRGDEDDLERVGAGRHVVVGGDHELDAVAADHAHVDRRLRQGHPRPVDVELGLGSVDRRRPGLVVDLDRVAGPRRHTGRVRLRGRHRVGDGGKAFSLRRRRRRRPGRRRSRQQARRQQGDRQEHAFGGPTSLHLLKTSVHRDGPAGRPPAGAPPVDRVIDVAQAFTCRWRAPARSSRCRPSAAASGRSRGTTSWPSRSASRRRASC